MKINVFNTQCHIGSTIKMAGRKFKVKDIDRSTHEVIFGKMSQRVRCTEVELVNEDAKK